MIGVCSRPYLEYICTDQKRRAYVGEKINMKILNRQND